MQCLQFAISLTQTLMAASTQPPPVRPAGVWQDFDHDGKNTHSITDGSSTLELRSLQALGIVTIDYANSSYEVDSGLRNTGVANSHISYASASTVTLEAEQEGSRTSRVGAVQMLSN